MQPEAQPPKRKRSTGATIAAALVLVAAACGVGACIIGITQDEKPVDVVTDDQSADAEIMCQSFVKKRLKAPATAKFPEADRIQKDGATYTVAGGVDAQNSYGALVRTPFICVVHADGGDKWTLLDLQLQKI